MELWSHGVNENGLFITCHFDPIRLRYASLSSAQGKLQLNVFISAEAEKSLVIHFSTIREIPACRQAGLG